MIFSMTKHQTHKKQAFIFQHHKLDRTHDFHEWAIQIEYQAICCWIKWSLRLSVSILGDFFAHYRAELKMEYSWISNRMLIELEYIIRDWWCGSSKKQPQGLISDFNQKQSINPEASKPRTWNYPWHLATDILTGRLQLQFGSFCKKINLDINKNS